MKSTPLTLAVERVVALKMKAIDKVMKDLIEPIEKVGNPEQLIGKEYAQWTPEDLTLLTKIYGRGADTPLTRVIFNREFEKVKKLEVEEGM